MFSKIILYSIITALSLSASQTHCSNIYFNNDAPNIINQKLLSKTQELCYKQFGVMHSGETRTPLWSAERITKKSLNGKAVRSNEFHAEERLPAENRAELSDYSHSGYDRGHLTCSADEIDPQANYETFSLANIVPENQAQNRGIWADIERSTRELAKKNTEIFVITGPIFLGENLQKIGGRVLVPKKLFKAIFVPSTGLGAAYISDNTSDNTYKRISISELEELSGIDVFPQMSNVAKNNAMMLPEPIKYHGEKGLLIEQESKNNFKNNFFDKLHKKVTAFKAGFFD